MVVAFYTVVVHVRNVPFRARLCGYLESKGKVDRAFLGLVIDRDESGSGEGNRLYVWGMVGGGVGGLGAWGLDSFVVVVIGVEL